MSTRRTFLRTAVAGFTGVAALGIASPENAAEVRSPNSLQTNPKSSRFRPTGRFGLGGCALGNLFASSPEEEFLGAVNAAWNEGIRYFDTSPWYGLGLSERRLGVFLQGRPRDEFVVSTKIGRLLMPDASVGGKQVAVWHDVPPFGYSYDYSAEGTRRSIEESLQRLGLARIDIVFIHDISSDNPDMKEKWTEFFETARRGAMIELTRMRKEGLIKAWGMGVNEVEPARRALEVADPDIILLATQYSLMQHDDALKTLFPVAQAVQASIVVGTPLMVGFLAGRERYLWDNKIPPGALEKRARLSRIAQDHGTDLLTISLQFCNAPAVVAAVLAGARTGQQVRQNTAAMCAHVPPELWQALKRERLIADVAPTPA
jgi:D-threo-aldose 1-dehydrogenase